MPNSGRKTPRPEAPRGAEGANSAKGRGGSKGRAPGQKGATLCPTCVDEESGFYHQEHFERSLKYEMARALETERPLGLLIVSLREADGGAYSVLGGVFQGELRRIDMPARLSDGRVAVILPRVSLFRLARQLERIDGLLGDASPPLRPQYGFSLYHADGEWDASDLVSEAGELMDAGELAKLLRSKTGRYAGSALLPEEKDTLFQGFSQLRGESD